MSVSTFRLRPLSDLFQVDKAQISKDEFDYSKLQFIGLENIESHTKRYLPEFLSEPEGVCHRFNKNHLLYGKLRPYLNKVYLPDFEGKCSTEIVPLLPKNGYSREFIATILQSQTFIEEAVKHSTGGRMPRANLKHLLKLKVSVPEAEEANAIARDLQSQLAHVESVRQAALKQKEAAKALQSSILRDMFPWQAGESLPSGWRWETINSVCSDITDGTHVTPHYIKEGIPFLSVQNVRETGIILDKCKFISQEEHELLTKRCKPVKGDVLYTKVGTTGIAKLVDVEYEFSIFVSVALLKLKPEYFNEYIEVILNSPICKAQAESMTQGAGNQNLVLQDLKKIYFPVPTDYNKQMEVANEVLQKKKTLNEIKAIANNQLAAIESLPAAILREAFNFEKTEK